MPVIGEELFQYPDSLFANGAEPIQGEWTVVHVQPRSEKAFARKIIEREISCYLPVRAKQLKYHNRVLESFLPVFPGYVFVKLLPEFRSVLLETRKVVSLIPVHDQNRLETELQQISRLMDSGVPLFSEPKLLAGMQVELVEGPLKGLLGKIVRMGKKSKLVIEVNLICQGVSIEIDNWHVMPLNNRTIALSH
jgi:transcription antitermination factor NusG